MNKTLIAITLSSLLPLAALAANPQPATATDVDAAPAVASAEPAAAVSAKAAVVDRQCLRETGSRIQPRKNAKGERACLPLSGRSYSRDELQRTGKTDVAEALRVLDPAIR